MINKNQIRITLQIIVAVLLGLEVSIPPNPYKMPLIVMLVILICLKYEIPNKLSNQLFKWKKGKS
jgi:hypothetical protein